MNTRILYVDDDRAEAEELLHLLRAELCKIAPLTRVLIQAQPSTRAAKESNSDSLEFDFSTPADLPDARSAKKLAALSMSYQLFLLDVSWVGHDPTDVAGLEYAVALHKAGVALSRVLLITNKSLKTGIEKGATPLLRGGDGSDYDVRSKGDPEEIASEVWARAFASPTRVSIRVIGECLDVVLGSDAPLRRFFHQGGAEPTIAAVLDACKRLRRTKLVEAAALHSVVEARVRGLKEYSTLKDHLSERKWVEMACTTKDLSDTTRTSISTVANSGDFSIKLKDLLFPRLRDGLADSFRQFADLFAGNYAVDLLWRPSPPARCVQNALKENGKDVITCLPVSWFARVFTNDWIRGLPKEKKSDRRRLWVLLGNTDRPYHRFVLFWNDGFGYPDISNLMNSALGAFGMASEFAHAFVASKLRSGHSALIEVLPERTREMPSARLCIGSTVFDFSRWNKGSAYLFLVPGKY